MYVRGRPVVFLLVIGASSCGRIGYDQILDLGAPSAGNGGSAGGASAGSDSGSTADGGATNPGSGGRTGAGGTDSGATESGGGGGAAGTGGAVGSGGVVVGGDAGIVGCADGQREGFVDLATYPAIAACAGGFALPGVVGLSGPACGRTAGDDGANPGGSACNAADLCAVGFHICSSSAEVAQKSSSGCTGAAVGATPVFFITAQSGLGSRNCDATGTDDVFGCGTLGTRPVNGSNCAPLDDWSTDLCGALAAPWACGTDSAAEAANVVKPGPTAGGVLCCQD